jgi:hypothetical protein
LGEVKRKFLQKKWTSAVPDATVSQAIKLP